MKFVKTPLKDAYVIELEKREDERGFFARYFCLDEFEKAGLTFVPKQGNISRSLKKGTLRGLHFQLPPHGEDKLIRCSKGRLYDVIIDLRKDSPTYKQWFGTELSAENHKQLLCPKGFAHGHITLEDNTEITYLVSEFYTPGAEGGVRYNDPIFNISWPTKIESITDKDKNWPDYQS